MVILGGVPGSPDVAVIAAIAEPCISAESVSIYLSTQSVLRGYVLHW
jgi:hypothetical protein